MPTLIIISRIWILDLNESYLKTYSFTRRSMLHIILYSTSTGSLSSRGIGFMILSNFFLIFFIGFSSVSIPKFEFLSGFGFSTLKLFLFRVVLYQHFVNILSTILSKVIFTCQQFQIVVFDYLFLKVCFSSLSLHRAVEV